MAAGVVDELRLHVAPVLLGAGTKLFADADHRIELLPVRVIDTPMAAHLTYRVLEVAKRS
ncbi:MAG: dihydrofolate reductase family protein [Candidatus Limnocylindrales bacterium]